MGKRRKSPRTEKTNTVGKYGGLQYATSSMQGWRLEMEDQVNVSLRNSGKMKKWAYAGVFDGHCGKKTAKQCSKHLCKRIFKNVSRRQASNCLRVREDIIQGYLQQDQKMNESNINDDDSGSTAVCTIISPTHWYIANCGDSRAVLSRNGRVGFATKDHIPTNSVEKKRIIQAGGFVRGFRVNGRLAMSRAMGDFEYKTNRSKSPCSQVVIPKPDVTVLERNREADEFMLLACDGIWDVMTNSELVTFVRNQMSKTKDLKLICNRLLDHCLFKGSRDNMSAVLIKLPGCPTKEVLKQKRKLEFAKMHQAIKAKKLKPGSNDQKPKMNQKPVDAPTTNESQVKPKSNRVPINAYMRFYLDYLKTHRGNICELAKKCGSKWRNLEKGQKQIYQRRYLQAKRRLVKRQNKPIITSEPPVQNPEPLMPSLLS
ncbi:Protein phosphatase 1A [Orchesella cincta]|uniref:Protein phosphatase 1A n=1 Tax=Orchesella cincta TaxID=48709 RepID=A0A1D2N8R5_ORCCI|nr:Protein phosphatase 1A [Orchesella cincta]